MQSGVNIGRENNADEKELTPRKAQTDHPLQPDPFQPDIPPPHTCRDFPIATIPKIPRFRPTLGVELGRESPKHRQKMQSPKKKEKPELN